MKHLARWLRTLADRIDYEGAPKLMHWSFSFEIYEGIRFREDGKGCRLAYLGDAEYEKAHAEADNPAPRVDWKALAKASSPEEYRRTSRYEQAAAPVHAPHTDGPGDDCRGFRWIGQSFATCDGCGKPAWEHEGMSRLREGAPLVGGAEDWEVRPWGPGEADAIKRKWG